MSKSILMSIQPKWVCEILNGRKTIEIRRKFSKNYVGWVYIYCTKGKQLTLYKNKAILFNKNSDGIIYSYPDTLLNGKVVARFWCDKVEEIVARYDELYCCYDFGIFENVLLRKSCLENWELGEYLKITNNNDYEEVGYAIHISKLEVFDKPRPLYGFIKGTCDNCKNKGMECSVYDCRLTKAPQNYCYVEE